MLRGRRPSMMYLRWLRAAQSWGYRDLRGCVMGWFRGPSAKKRRKSVNLIAEPDYFAGPYPSQ